MNAVARPWGSSLACTNVLSFGQVAARLCSSVVAWFVNEGWSLYGAPWLQPVATGRKPLRRGSGRDKRKPLPWVATSCRSQRMVRRGSTVRVRQRALQKPSKSQLFLSKELARAPVCGGYGAVYGAFRLRSCCSATGESALGRFRASLATPTATTEARAFRPQTEPLRLPDDPRWVRPGPGPGPVDIVRPQSRPLRGGAI